MKETKKYDNWMKFLTISVIVIIVCVFTLTVTNTHLAKGTYGATCYTPLTATETYVCPTGSFKVLGKNMCCPDGTSYQFLGGYCEKSDGTSTGSIAGSSQKVCDSSQNLYEGQYCCSKEHTFDSTTKQCCAGSNSSTSTGSATSTGSTTSTTYKCPAGQYYPGNGASCKACEKGSYCPGETYRPTAIVSMGIHPCPDGYTTVGTGASTVSECSVETTTTTKTCVVGQPYIGGDGLYYASVTFSGMTINQCCASKGWNATGGRCYTGGGKVTDHGTEYVYHEPVDGECAEGYKKISVAYGTGRKTVCVEERCNCDDNGCDDATIEPTPTSSPTPTGTDPTPTSGPTYACYLVNHKYVWASSKPSGGTLVSSITNESKCSGCESSYTPNNNNNCVKPSSNPSSNVPVNPKTGTVGIIVAWVIGLAAIVYSLWYFKKSSSIK